MSKKDEETSKAKKMSKQDVKKDIVNRKGMVRKAFVFQQRCYCLRFPMSRDDEAGSKPGLTKSRNY